MASGRKARRLQKLFEGTDFMATKVLYEAPLLTAAPHVYVDESTRRWAVRLPGAIPRIFAYEDVLACEIAEAQPPAQEDASGGKRLRSLLANPTRASQANAAKRDYCLGMGVVVAVRSPEAEGGVAHLQLPLLTRETKRSSTLYQRMLQYAQQIKATFDAMGGITQQDNRE